MGVCVHQPAQEQKDRTVSDGNGVRKQERGTERDTKKIEGGLRERPLDKVSTLSVDGMTMTPLWEGRVSQGHCHHTRELEPNLQQGTGKERGDDVTLKTDSSVGFSFCTHEFSIFYCWVRHILNLRFSLTHSGVGKALIRHQSSSWWNESRMNYMKGSIRDV